MAARASQATWNAEYQSLLDIARSTPLGLLSYLLGDKYLSSIFLQYLNGVLLSCAVGESPFLLISAPPRHGKSVLCTHAFITWYLGIHPDNRVLFGSYEADFAASWGRKCRDTMMMYGPRLWGVQVRQDSAAVNRWNLEHHNGGMDTAGVGGAFMGKGGDLIIIDDPVKNAQEAMSQVYRDATWEWFESTVMTRREPYSSVIVTMQRWHQDDLIGRILRNMPELGWKEIVFPAIAEEDDVLGRRPGEPLFPERFPLGELLEVKMSKSAYWWGAQYQQHPSPPSGSIFLRDHWVFYQQLPERFEQVIMSWDMAFKGTKDSDYVAGHVWGKAGANFFLLDRTHGKMGMSRSLESVRMMKNRHPKARAILIEDAANGPAIIELLKNEISGIIAVKPEGGKVARANAIEPYQHAGNIHLPDPTRVPWVKDFVEECANFPAGVHDDDVDAMTQAINYLATRRTPSAFVVG